LEIIKRSGGAKVMLIKQLQGRYAGEIQDISNDVALDLIRLGRAARPFTEENRADRQPAPPCMAKPAGKKKRLAQ
jgi:hypothetical protein